MFQTHLWFQDSQLTRCRVQLFPTYAVRRSRRSRVCCGRRRPWRCKLPLIQSRRCLPSGPPEPLPAQQQQRQAQNKQTKTKECSLPLAQLAGLERELGRDGQ